MKQRDNQEGANGMRPNSNQSLKERIRSLLHHVETPTVLGVDNGHEPHGPTVPTRRFSLCATKYTTFLVALMLTLTLTAHAPIIQVTVRETVPTVPVATVTVGKSSFADVETAVNLYDTPDHVSEETVVTLVKETANRQLDQVNVVFVDRIAPDEPYTSGSANLASNTIYIRNSLTEEGVKVTVVHEVAHLLTGENNHAQTWCDNYLNALRDVLPERYDGQVKQSHLRYNCLTTANA